MRSHGILFAVLVAIVAVLAFSVGPASADGEGATITKDFTCFVDVAPIDAQTTDQSIDVGTPSENTNLVCHFRAEDFVGPLPTETVHLTDIPCTTFEGVGIGHGVFTANGNGMFTCQIRANA